MPDFPRCPYRPTQGLNKNLQCVLHVQHAEARTAHSYDAALLGTGQPAQEDDPDSAFTNAELDQLTEEEIQRRAQALDEAQESWEQAKYRATPKIACPECTGRGTVIGGSLGDHCPSCNGTRLIDDPGAPDLDFESPDFRTPKAALAAYGDALIWRRAGRQLALPPVAGLPTMAEIEKLRQGARAVHRQISAGGAPKLPELPSGDPHRDGLNRDGGIEDTASNQEIDALEAEIVEESRPRGRR